MNVFWELRKYVNCNHFSQDTRSVFSFSPSFPENITNFWVIWTRSERLPFYGHRGIPSSLMMTNSEAWRFDVFLTHHFFIRIFFINSKISLTFRFDERVVVVVVYFFCYYFVIVADFGVYLLLNLTLCQPEIKVMSGFFVGKCLLILLLLFLWRSLENECYLDPTFFIGFVNYFFLPNSRVKFRSLSTWLSDMNAVDRFDISFDEEQKRKKRKNYWNKKILRYGGNKDWHKVLYLN